MSGMERRSAIRLSTRALRSEVERVKQLPANDPGAGLIRIALPLWDAERVLEHLEEREASA